MLPSAYGVCMIRWSDGLITYGGWSRDLEKISSEFLPRSLSTRLLEFYGISTAFAIHSLAGFLSHSLFAHLIVRYSLTCWISIAFVIQSLDHSLFVRLTSYKEA